jgi:hypothetical protein
MGLSTERISPRVFIATTPTTMNTANETTDAEGSPDETTTYPRRQLAEASEGPP